MGRPRKSIKDINIPIDLYNKGILGSMYGKDFINELSNTYNVDFSESYYGNINLWKYGVLPSKNTDMYKYALVHRNEILNSYLNESREKVFNTYFSNFKKVRVSDIMVFLGLWSDSIQKLRKKHHITKMRSPQHKNPFKFPLNDISAYTLGFIVGDGCITCNTKEIYNRVNKESLVIACNDYHIIKDIAQKAFEIPKESLEKFIGRNDYHGKYKTTYYFSTNDYETIQSLFSLGVRKQKSRNGCNIKVPKNMYAPFVRGLLDSDGYIRQKVLSNGCGAEVEICGHKSYLKDVIDNTDFAWKYSENENLAFIALHKQSEVRRFYSWVYHNSEIKLERKYNAMYYTLERGELYGKYREYSSN